MKRNFLTALALTLPLGFASAVTFTTDTFISAGDSAYDNQDVVVSGCTLTVDGAHTFASLALSNNATLTHSSHGQGHDTALKLELAVTGNLIVDASSRVDVSGRGYACISGVSYGPGAGTGILADYGGGGGGGAYGGNGGAPESPYAGGRAYGSPSAPSQHGSAGGAGYPGQGGAGGGYVRLVVGGTLLLDGQISANGSNGAAHSYGASGGGAGGGVWLTVNHFSGVGQITANGGLGYVVSEEDSGGGGGGRIAVHCQNSSFAGTMSARGAASGSIPVRSGGAGTVFLKANAADRGQLVMDNGGLEGVVTPWIQPDTFGALIVSNRAIVEVLGGATLLVPDRIVVGSSGTLLCRATNVNALLGDSWQGMGATITSATLRVEIGGLITATGQGYVGTVTNGCGPGGGTGTRADITGGGGGGAHGGNGGNPQSPYAGGLAYGSVTQPLAPGSAGGAGLADNGGAGGGAVKIVAAALELEGQITANGLAGGAHSYGASGGGAGGSLWLQLGTFSGSGLVAVNGGDSYVVTEEDGGGGAGGRIAIYYAVNTFGGELQAYGGLSGNGINQGQAGGAGTIYLQSTAQTVGNLIVDNRGVLGALTPWPSTFTLDEITIGGGGNLEIYGETSWTGAALNVTDGGVLHLGDAATLRLNSLTMTSNALFYCHGQNASDLVDGVWAGSGVTLEAQTVNVGVGAIITADGQGYTGTNTKGNGPGAGDGSRNDEPDGGGSGGAYGGNGGNAEGPWIPGSGYGSVAQPLELGSAGGAGFAGPGANGGGAFRLIVAGECLLDGTITAKGLNGAAHSYGAAGGGAGGSVWISAGTFSGAGTVDVRGGDGAIVNEEDSGGGGGGRIAVEAEVNNFAGMLLTQGGAGIRGGAGTIYLKTSPQSVGNLIVDNGGLAGARTSLTGKESFDHVRVQNRGLLELLPGQAFSAASVTVATNGTLATQGGATLLAGQLTVENGGVMQCESTNHSLQIGGEWAGYGSELLIGTVVVQPGGVLTAAGLGYTGTDGRGNGPGGGSGIRADINGGGGGGGYGGNGGPGEVNQPGGQSYGSADKPVDLGSAGGAGNAGRGGAGGGVIRIIATNQVVANGLISADGAAGAFHRYGASGGGAGGSIWISTRNLTGASGAIQAAGGQGWVVSEEDSGGGGGGRIALDLGSVDFAGTLSVSGGAGGSYGGNGTILTNYAVPCLVTPIGGTAMDNTVEFTLQFAEPVTGLTQDDVWVENGTKLALTSGGDTYRLTVRAVGGVVTCVVAGSVADSAGIPNAQSNRGFVYVAPPKPPLLSVERQPAGLHVSWPSVAGFNYQLQTASELSVPTWLNEGVPFEGAGGLLSTNLPIGPDPVKFIRVLIVN